MAGLFGFFTRAARSPDWMHARIERLRRAMVSRPDHRSHVEIYSHAAFGNTGPGLHAGTLTSYRRADGSVLMAEGEVYRLDAWSSATRPFEEAWPLLHDQWNDSAAALTDVDGLYSLVRYEGAENGPRLSIANDRYGSRRLYVLEDGDEFVFAADFQALVAWLGSRFEIDPRFIADAVCLGAPLEDRTWARQIRLFPPGSEWRVTPGGLAKTRYWRPSLLPGRPERPPHDMIACVDALWHDALARRLRGDRLGQQLSGGLDSRLILAEGRERESEWLTVTYGERGSDEVRFAEACAKAVGVPWLFWELPGDQWLERRVVLSLENGGFLDLLNAHHAGLVEYLRGKLRFEISGYAGDVIVGDTYGGLSPEAAFRKLPYWASPASEDEATVQARVLDNLGAQDTWGWILETKMRRTINAWPQLAVNDLEVRKPFMDYALVEYCASLPLSARRVSVLHERLLAERAPVLKQIPIQRTGVPPGSSTVRRLAMRIVRQLHRVVQPRAMAFGFPMRPWVRGAMDMTPWLQDASIHTAMRDTLLATDARITSFVARKSIADTLALGLAGGVASEVPLNLYRIERVLRHLPQWCEHL